MATIPVYCEKCKVYLQFGKPGRNICPGCYRVLEVREASPQPYQSVPTAKVREPFADGERRPVDNA